jgi:hypothetical protein
MRGETTFNERDLAAAAATRKLLRQFPLVFDAVLADIQSNDHPAVRLLCWLGNQEIPLVEQPLEVQQRLPRGRGHTILSTAQAMRKDFGWSLKISKDRAARFSQRLQPAMGIKWNCACGHPPTDGSHNGCDDEAIFWRNSWRTSRAGVLHQKGETSSIGKYGKWPGGVTC